VIPSFACKIFGGPVVRLAVGLASAIAPLAAVAETVAPSGLELSLHEVRVEENPWSGEIQVVVRLLAPEIAQGITDPVALRADMDWACATWGQPTAATLSAPPDQVVVEMMAAPVARGTATPEIRRFFETYRLDGPSCIWDLF